jgi:predicted CoA-binding protein
MTSPRAIESFLAQPAIAVVGVSRSGHKFGNVACRALRAKGYRVYPVNRRAASIDAVRCYVGLGALPEKVDAVLVVVRPREACGVIEEAAAAGAHHVWLQQGAESAAAADLASTLGIELVAGECILMFANPTGVHKMHRTIRAVLGKLPARLANPTLNS